MSHGLQDLVQDVPRSKTRRGKRGKGGPKGQPHDHMKNCQDCFDKGDHDGAKKHAFAFIRSLGAKSGGPAPMVSSPEAPAKAAAAKPSGNASRLVAALRKR